MGQSKQKLTLKDVAQLLNVSTATVSNAFGRPSQLSRELREHILEQCRQLGYTGPNAAARSLRTGKTGIVGIMFSNYLSYSFSDPVAHQYLQGLAEVFEECEYNLLVIPSRDHVSQGSGYESFVEGYVIYGPPQPKKLRHLISQNKSIITVDFEIEGYLSVNIDNYHAAKFCADHALGSSSGKSPAAILGLRINDQNRVCLAHDGVMFKGDSIITIQRLNGFLDSAQSMNMPISFDRVWQIPDNTHQLGYQAAREALSANPRPDLLLCMSDRIALAALQACRHMGLRVPEDVRVTGFDDIPEAHRQHPTLTTVHQQSVDKGRIAAELFLGLREQSSVVIPAKLMIRESCP